MAASTTLELDTTGPQGLAASLAGGAPSTGDPNVSLAVSTTSNDAVQAKIYGDVDDAANTGLYRALEANAPWVAFASPFAIKLAAGDGTKVVRVKLRDDVDNVSAEQSDAINLDSTAPVVTVRSQADPTKVSENAGHRTSTFAWDVDEVYTDFKVKVVPSVGSTHDAGTTIGSTNGSSNVAATGGNFAANTQKVTSIDGRDLKAAASGDGSKIIKVFVKDVQGNWSL